MRTREGNAEEVCGEDTNRFLDVMLFSKPAHEKHLFTHNIHDMNKRQIYLH